MKITEYGITVVYLMILCRIAYVDWKYQIIEPWTHIGILTLACMEMLFRVGVSVQERCLGAVVIAVPMLVLTVLLKGGFGGGDIKLMAVSGFLNGVKVITYAGMLGIILSGIYVSMMLAAGKMGRKDSFALGPFLVMGIVGMKLWTSIS
ncbi:A24 family peptidase [Dorea amylophila]|uniref:A24 family peptidase n=1 Tax=Dorea amylophila TaxID=2981789 RepID=UPI0032663318